MKRLSIAFAIAAITAGSAHAVDYSFENFEGGTPNYTITAGVLTQLQSGGVGITSTTALAGTAYNPGSPSRSGIFANGTVPEVTGEPTGQHGFVSNSVNRSLILSAPMTLTTDGVTSLDISFKTMVYGLGVTFDQTAEVVYSALGDFTDSVQIATYSTALVANPGTALTHFTVVEDTWSTLNLSISSTAVTFTNTAKIRFNKLPVAQTEHMVFYDDIVITGQTVPVPTAPFVVTIAPAVNPNTGYDLQWNSQAGSTYSVLTSTDLSTPVESWAVLAAGLAPNPPQNTYNVPAAGERRFYVIKRQ